MRKPLLFLAALLLATACYNTHEANIKPPPEDLIHRDTIVNILADVEIAESALRQKQNYGHEITGVKENYYHAIFSKYKVSRARFDSSMAYYKQDLETMNGIYEDVISRLSVIESKVQME
jgi:hypothetical protein